MRLADLRLAYTKGGLLETEVRADPFEQFRVWFQQAAQADCSEPNAMALATAGADASPCVRMVLLKGFDRRGFVWYTNYASRKGRELAAVPRASLLFYWAELERQVRIEGSVDKVAPEESDEYFASRPRGHQLGAWASEQSSEVASRAVLERNAAAVAERFGREEVTRPSHWGGYRLAPQVFEFWQGRPDRLHDRLEYRAAAGDEWVLRRLAP